MAQNGPKTAVKDLSVSLLDGIMTLKVDAIACKKTEETIKFSLICPGEDEPIRPRQMYVHPDDVDSGTAARMWTTAECDRAREVDGILYRVTAEEIEASKEPVLPPGQIDIHVYPAEDFEKVTRPNGTVMRLRPKAVPHVYAMLTDLVKDETKAYAGELTIRGVQRLYRMHSWDGTLILQEQIRPGEFYEAEGYDHDYPAALLSKMQNAVEATLAEFNPDEFVSVLRERAAALDAAKKDPNAPQIKASEPKESSKESVDDLMALLDSVAAPKKPAKRAVKK